MNITYSQASTDQSGTVYIGNIEYNTLHGNATQTTLSRIYNDEGYVENPANPQYYYFRHDHLGDNREVWLANTNTTVQRTQYYPSGLPWASNDGDNPGLQHRKYNGKEFVEMHGYDTYDIEWRQYYPAIMRFQTVDPLAEKYYSISPYAYCKGDPINYIDHDGKFSLKWFANISGDWYNLWHKDKAGPIIENKDATKANFKYAFKRLYRRGWSYTFGTVNTVASFRLVVGS